MKNKKSKLLPICLLLALLGSSALPRETLPASQKSFLWKIQSQATTAYVLGSLHYSKKEMYPLSEKIEKAFDASEILVVEADVNDVKKFDILKLVERAFYPEDDTLEKHVSPELYERVVKEAAGLGMSAELLNKQKPWFLAMTLVALESLKLGFDPNLGIDKYFLSKAEGRKETLELESLDYQFNLLSEFSDKDQELFLLYTLKDLKVMEEELERLTQAWTSGDTKTMEAILTRSASEDKRLSFIFEKLIYERNGKMASKIEDYLRTGKTYFVIVGAGHLVSDRGIVEILRRKGYRIEQL